MRSAKVIAGILLLFATPAYCAAAPCDFKGVSVGDKLAKKELMAKLGIKRFKINPDVSLVRSTENDERQYGYLVAQDMALLRVGPYCLGNMCFIPYGVEIQKKIPSFMQIIFAGDRVTDIQVRFDPQYWQQVSPGLIQKYGLNSFLEEHSPYVTTDDTDKKPVTEYRTIIANKSGGANDKTGSRCELSATRYDGEFLKTHDPIESYRAILNIDFVQVQDCKAQTRCSD